MPGRIETYTHSDSTTENKGACIVKIACETDFGAKTDEFKAFCKYAARMIYAAGTPKTIDDVIVLFPEFKEHHEATVEALKEFVLVRDFKILLLETDEEVTSEKISDIVTA